VFFNEPSGEKLPPLDYKRPPSGGGNKIKEVDELSSEEGEGGFNSNNDSGIQKVLSRTKNSLQLHTLNKNDEEDEYGDDDDLHHHNDEIPNQLLPEDEPINSDFRRNILDQSVDNDNLLDQVPQQSPILKEHLHRNDFFSENFDSGTPQTIINQIKPIPHGGQRVSPQGTEKQEPPLKDRSYKIPIDEGSSSEGDNSNLNRPPPSAAWGG
jgi:hypothetical protein